MTTNIKVEKSPNEALADLVGAKLKERGFVADGKFDEIVIKLATGKATREDWNLWIDVAQSEQPKDGTDGSN